MKIYINPSDGYNLAKRQMIETLSNRILILEEQNYPLNRMYYTAAVKPTIAELEKIIYQSGAENPGLQARDE
jgi:hypothetical protein